MARTTKTEWTRPDGWHVSCRLERKARPAGRLRRLVEAELDAADMTLAPRKVAA